MANETYLVENWYPNAIASCQILQVFGSWISFNILFGIILNGYILFLFINNKDLQSVSNGFVVSISLCDFMACILGMPLPMIANLTCRWPFGKFGCYYEAFVTYFVSASSMYILTLFSIDRYIAITMPYKHKQITPRIQIIGIGACCTAAFLCAVFPLLGWSSYSMEGALTTCSIKWQDKTFNVVSYNTFIFVFLMVIPVLIMIYCNIKIYMKIRNVARWGIRNWNDPLNKKKLKTEKKVLKTSLFMIGGFLSAWTPYAVVALISAFGNPNAISPIGATFPSLFAKSQVLWNPLIYVLTNKNFQIKFPFLKSNLFDEVNMYPLNAS